MTDFMQKAEDSEASQKRWVEFSQQLNDDYLRLKSENNALKKQAQSLGLLNEDGYTYSELSKDLQSQGIQCLENIP